MKIYKFHLLIISLIVLILYSFKPLNFNSLKLNNSNNITNNLQILHTKYEFANIFVTNIVVGLVISIAGFFTAGLLTLSVIVWNLLLLWLIYSSVISNHGDIRLILYLSKHSPVEIYAFALFSIIGFRGFKFYKKLIVFQEFDNKLFPNVKEMLLPSLLLLCASLIEVS